MSKELEALKNIEKSLKALDIIKKCCVLKDLYVQNSIFGVMCSSEITKEEFEFLKDVLCSKN